MPTPRPAVSDGDDGEGAVEGLCNERFMRIPILRCERVPHDTTTKHARPSMMLWTHGYGEPLEERWWEGDSPTQAEGLEKAEEGLREPTTHYQGQGGVMGTQAACGAGIDTDLVLRQTEVWADVTCNVCIDLKSRIQPFGEGCPDCGADTIIATQDGDMCSGCGWRP